MRGAPGDTRQMCLPTCIVHGPCNGKDTIKSNLVDHRLTRLLLRGPLATNLSAFTRDGGCCAIVPSETIDQH